MKLMFILLVGFCFWIWRDIQPDCSRFAFCGSSSLGGPRDLRLKCVIADRAFGPAESSGTYVSSLLMQAVG